MTDGSRAGVDPSVLNVLRFSGTELPIYYSCIWIYVFLIYISMYAGVYLYGNIYRPHHSRPLKNTGSFK